MLYQKKNEVILINLGDQSRAKDYKIIVNKKVKLLFLNFYKQTNPFNFFKLLKFHKLLSKLNPDVIHSQVGYFWLIPSLYLSKKPKVLTVHDPALKKGRDQPIHSELTKNSSLHISNKIIVHGVNLKKILVEEFNQSPSNVNVIPHGHFAHYKKWRISKSVESGYNVLFFGKILEYKGVEYLVKSEPLIRKVHPDVKITIAGSGDISPYLSYLMPDSNIEFINEFIPNSKVSELFEKCSVVVLPYTDGSQSGIVPIAYSFSKPVVVTDVGSLAEVVKDGKTGFLIEPNNSKLLSQAVIKILSDNKLREKMGRNALNYSKTTLSWAQISLKTIETYMKAIKSHV